MNTAIHKNGRWRLFTTDLGPSYNFMGYRSQEKRNFLRKNEHMKKVKDEYVKEVGKWGGNTVEPSEDNNILEVVKKKNSS